MSSNSREDLYQRSGILDLRAFYREKFLSDEILDQRYFKALDRFDIRFARTMWVYDNVRNGATVLDLGCGAGMLALLKKKGVTLVGIDLSAECALAAKRNGYDETFCADLARLPFSDGTFDYVVSLDVMGHVAHDQKDAVLGEVKRVLRPDGVTMHGIECIDEASRRKLEQMSPAELRRFVEVDGHVGLEEEESHAARFEKFFAHVAWEPRYALCLSSEEFLKQAEAYGLPFEADFLNYLRGLTFKERRAFDVAMGYVFARISDLNIRLPKSGLYMFLKASGRQLGPFYNEHRERLSLATRNDELSCLDRSPKATFDDGWYEPDMLPPVARWMSKRASVSFMAHSLNYISFDLTTHIPELHEQPLGLELLLNGERLGAWSIFRYGWINVRIPVPSRLVDAASFTIELKADRTWQPRPADGSDLASRKTRDDRELSVAVCNLEVE